MLLGLGLQVTVIHTGLKSDPNSEGEKKKSYLAREGRQYALLVFFILFVNCIIVTLIQSIYFIFLYFSSLEYCIK